MTANTWPDPARPGVPPAPGWYWIGHFGGEKGIRFFDGDFWRSGTYFTGPEDYAHLHLLAPVLTPDEASALQARADRNAAGFARVDAEAERAKFLHKQEIAALQKRVAKLEGALREMVYEATHLSPQNIDGSHWCKISKDALEKARAALEGKKDE